MAQTNLKDKVFGTEVRDNLNDNFDEVYELRDETTPNSAGFAVNKQIKGKVNDHTPIFTVAFDDGHETHYDNWFPLLTGLGVVGCISIVTDWVGTPNYMTWAQIIEMEAAGWEVLSHSKSHPHSILLTDEQLTDELSGSLSVLTAQGLEVNNYAWTFEEGQEREQRFCRNHYRSAKGYHTPALDDPQLNEDAYRPFVYRSAGSEEITDEDGLQNIKDQLDEALAENKWFVWTGHIWSADRGTALQEIIEYAQGLDIDIVTVNQALDRKYNYLEFGGKFAVGENGVRIDEADGDAIKVTERRVAIGIKAGDGNREDANTFIGYYAGQISDGIRNVYIGDEAGNGSDMGSTVAIGYNAGLDAVGGSLSVYVGNSSGRDATGSIGVFFGSLAGRNSTGDNCVGIGNQACYGNTKDNYFELKQLGANSIPLLKGFFDTQDFIQGCPDGAVADSEMENNTAHFYADEAGGTLNVKVKYSNGLVATGVISSLSTTTSTTTTA